MIRNYIKTALRNIRNQKVYAFINIAGLAIGICVAVFLFLFIDYELGFDSHVRDAEHLYRVVRHVETPTGIRHGGSNYFPLSKALRNDFSELSAVTQTYSLNDEVIWVDKQRFDNNLAMFVEADFFKMMQPQWIVEDVNRASDPGSVILTESLSLKYFGSLNTVGRRITLGDSLELSISGIVADPPKQSSLPYELLISWGAMKHYFNNDYLTRWNYLNGGSQAFLKLRQSVSKEDFEAQLDVFKLKYLDPEDHGSHSFHLQSLSDMHFDGRYGAQPYITSRTTLWAFGSTGLLILIVACINFVNLTTARAMRRAKEIGMRKVLGADRKLLLRQLMGETGVIIAIALLLGLGVVALVLPFVTAHLGVTMEVGRIFSGVSLGFFTGLFFFLLVINGLYPAMVLSRYQPAEALKSSRFTKGQQSTRIRNALVLFQFAVTQVLIVATLVIAAQVRYVGQKDLGFQKEGIVIVKSPYRTETAGQALRGRWMQNPHIQDVSFAFGSPSSERNLNTRMQALKTGDDTEYSISMKLCDSHFLDVYGIELLAGTFFVNNHGDFDHPNWVLNEEALKSLNVTNPHDIIGEEITINGQRGPVLGVVKNFHTFSLREGMMPVVLTNSMFWAHRRAHIRLDGIDLTESLKYIRETWEQSYPGEPFDYFFFDQDIQSRYASEARTLRLIQVASSLAIGIGCLGLLGLVAFVLAQRTKEIGIRKVLGASVNSLYYIIAKDFVKWILAANLISWPVAWYISREWLNGYAYRMTLNVGVFIMGSAMILGVALIVISFQVIKASRSNPINALKYE